MPLNSPCRDFVTWWNGGACPPAWNWPWLPGEVLWVTKLGPWQHAWPSGIRAGLGCRNKEPSSFLLAALGWCAGMLRPAAKVLAGSWGDSLVAFHCMLNSCCHRVGTAREGVLTHCLLGITKHFLGGSMKSVHFLYPLEFEPRHFLGGAPPKCS